MAVPVLIPIVQWAGAGALAGLGIKFAGDGVESVADSTAKLAGVAMIGAAIFVAYKVKT